MKACCFGGPKHGEVVHFTRAPVLVAMPYRLTAVTPIDSPIEMGPGFKEGRYDLERFGYRTKMGGVFVWDTLLWSGGWYQDRPIKDYVEDAMNICGFLVALLACW